jgi:DNA-binding transcriptional MerR regulator
MQRERTEEKNAIAQIMGGIEPDQNLTANPQFRLSVIQEIMMQPQFMGELMKKETSQKMLQTRVEAYQAQIQQYQENPKIGRALSTQSFNSKAPALQMTPAA